MRRKLIVRLMILMLVLAVGFLFVNKSHAADLGKGFTLDGYATLGKLWDVDVSSTETTQNLSVSTNKGEIYFDGELGLRYSFARPFLGYKYLGGVLQDETFSLKSAGVDFAPMPTSMPNIGIRASYNWFRVPGVVQKDFAYTGLMVKW